MSYILDTHNTNAYMHFKLYFPGTPDEIYTNMNLKQLKCIEETLTKIHCLYPEYDTLTAIDMLNYDRKNKLYNGVDTAICEILTSCLSELVNIEQQPEYERIGEIPLQSLTNNSGSKNNYILPLKITDLPLYIRNWLEKKTQSNENYCTDVCAIFNKDGNACDAWDSNKIYINIKKNTCWTAEHILYAHRNCGFIHDIRHGFTNVTYATGCCKYCKNVLVMDNNELCRRIESYNNSYRANYLLQNLSPGIWNPYAMCERLFHVNHKLGKPGIPPMIQWFMGEAAKLITDSCDNERRYQYDSYKQIYFTSEHILMDEDKLDCAIYYPGSEKSYNTLCDKCLTNWKYTRSILYDLITEWMLIWCPDVNMSLDNRYMFAKRLVKGKIYELKEKFA